jgi:membrane protease YdiL (CAAX protease family)
MALVSDPPPPPAQRPDSDDAPFPWYAPFVVGLSLYVALGVLVAAIAAAAGWSSLPDRFVLGATAVQDVLLIVVAYVVARVSGPRARYHLGVRRFKLTRALAYAFAAFVGFFVFLAVWQQILSIHQQDDLAQQLGARDSTANLVIVAVLVCVIAPIAEELFFRGFMFGALRRPIGWIGAAIVTGIVFGLIHAGGTDAVFLVPLAVLGFLLCWLYKQTGSLLPGMAVHAFNNALALGSTLHWDPGAAVAVAIGAPVLVVALVSLAAVPQGRAADPPGPLPAVDGDGGPPVFLPPIAPR